MEALVQSSVRLDHRPAFAELQQAVAIQQGLVSVHEEGHIATEQLMRIHIDKVMVFPDHTLLELEEETTVVMQEAKQHHKNIESLIEELLSVMDNLDTGYEAVLGFVSTEVETTTIKKTANRGYTFNSRLIRPAKAEVYFPLR